MLVRIHDSRLSFFHVFVFTSVDSGFSLLSLSFPFRTHHTQNPGSTVSKSSQHPASHIDGSLKQRAEEARHLLCIDIGEANFEERCRALRCFSICASKDVPLTLGRRILLLFLLSSFPIPLPLLAAGGGPHVEGDVRVDALHVAGGVGGAYQPPILSIHVEGAGGEDVLLWDWG